MAMLVSKEGILVALRVLVRWMEEERPSPEDIQQLKTYAPEYDNLPPDELACVVMTKYLRKME
jgi:hypothetical protein